MTLPSELCRTQHGRARTAKRATYVGSGCCRTYLDSSNENPRAPVRQVLAGLASEDAAGCVGVSSGKFTRLAREFTNAS
jgi:hypothetical protein